MYYLPNFYFAEMKILARIRSENNSMARWGHNKESRSRPEVILCLMKSCRDKEEVVETERRASRKISCRNTIIRLRHRRKTSLVTINFYGRDK